MRDLRTNNGLLQVLVHWKGYPASQDEWIDANDNTNCEPIFLFMSAHIARTCRKRRRS